MRGIFLTQLDQTCTSTLAHTMLAPKPQVALLPLVHAPPSRLLKSGRVDGLRTSFEEKHLSIEDLVGRCSALRETL